jgi:cathepsin B
VTHTYFYFFPPKYYVVYSLYIGGIYKHTTGKFLGGHAITIVGWGVGENNTAYWTVKNSWSEFWGEKGYFRIQRGVNMVGIENQLSGLSM